MREKTETHQNSSEPNKSLNTVLVVEDDEGLNHLIRKTLTREGYETQQALTGSEAISSLIKDPNKILLLDYLLPDMTGAHVIRAVMEEKLGVPFIVMTGHGDEKIAVDMMKQGVRDYVVKESGFIDNLPNILRRVSNELATERELARVEKALRVAAKEWQMTFDGISDAICLLDNEMKITQCNNAMSKLLQKQPEEIIGHQCYELVHCTKEPIEDCPLVRMKKTKQREQKLLHIEDKWLDIMAHPLFDEKGNLTGAVHVISDVTERKENERIIKEKEEQFRDLFENANDLIQAVKPDATFLYVNRAWRETLGYSEEELKSLTVFDILHPDSMQHCQQVFKRVMLGEDVTLVETSFKAKNGGKIDVEGSISCRFEGDKPVSTRAIFRNVTERKQAEERDKQHAEEMAVLSQTAMAFVELSPKEDIFKFIAEQLQKIIHEDAIIAVADLEENTGWFRARALLGVENVLENLTKSLGLDPKKMSVPITGAIRDILTSGGLVKFDRGIHELSGRIIPRPVASAIEKLMNLGDAYAMGLRRGGDIYGNICIIFRKGKKLPNTELIEAFVNQASVALEKRWAEEDLRNSESKYRTLLENLPQKIFYKDKNSTYISCNENYANDLNITPQEIIGKTDYEFYSKDLADKYKADDRRVIEAAQIEDIEEKYTIDGKDMFVHIVKTPIKDDKGDVTGILGIFWDITERKRAEQEKRKLKDQLQQSQKMEAIGQLAGGIAHDFNNLLGGISGYSDVLKIKMEQDSDLVKYVQKIQDAALRAAGLTHQLLTFARKARATMGTVDIHNAIDQAIGILERTIDRRIEIERHLGAHTSTVVGDTSMIENALLNLAINARDAMPGGGRLTLATEVMYLKQSWFRAQTFDGIPGVYLKVSVADTGIGMDKAIQAKVFEPFFTTKEMGKGTGLGLASVYGCVKQHNGYITVQSEPGKGSQFTLFLPLSESAVEEVKDEPELIHGEGTVLVVDDEIIMREAASDMLKALGYKVMSCENGFEAVEYFEKNYKETDAVLLDLIMPKMNGIDCYQKLKEINPQVRVVIASGYSDEKQDIQIKELGVEDFIEKPFKINQLSRCIADLLAKRSE